MLENCRFGGKCVLNMHVQEEGMRSCGENRPLSLAGPHTSLTRFCIGDCCHLAPGYQCGPGKNVGENLLLLPGVIPTDILAA